MTAHGNVRQPGRVAVHPPGSGRGLAAVSVCLLAGGATALVDPAHASLPLALRAHGLRVDPRNVRWLDPPGLGRRRALVLAASQGDPEDLYAVTARTAMDNGVITVDDVSDLTRSPEAGEESLVVHGRWAGFATRVGADVVAFTLVDTAGDADLAEVQGDPGARLRTAITRWQTTGRMQGYGFYRFDLVPRPRALALSFDHGALVASAGDRTARVEPGTQSVTQGAAWVRARPRLPSNEGWTGWIVNSVRGIPWVGPVPIMWAEHLVFHVQDNLARAEVRAGVDHSGSEVAEDLADVLHGGPSADVEGPVDHWPPVPLSVPFNPPLQHEGEWSAAAVDDAFVARNPGAHPAFYQSFVRTDPERPDTRVYVTLWDPVQVELHVVPGSQEPMGATGETGSGSVPRDQHTLLRLAAGFNGGFQALHGEWGVYAEGTLFLPPKPWGATVLALTDGSTAFGSWPQDTAHIPGDVAEFRQNLTSLVEDGVFNPYHRTFWGGNVPGSPPGESHTARTGLCLTRDGHVGFFWGNSLTERSLADGMLATHCTYGVHLDMNGANTGFEFLHVTPSDATPRLPRPLATGHEAEGPVPSAPGYTYRARRMVRGMHEMSFPRYIRRDPRDYFYLLLRPVLPGPALAAPIVPAQPGEGTWHVADLGRAAFPWPMARTRIRPDPGHPDRWVNLVRVDPRRVSMAPAEATEAVVARGMAGPGSGAESLSSVTLASDGGPPRWTVGPGGAGLAGTPLTPGSSTTRGAGIDANGFLVFAVADRPLPDFIAAALDLAGCGPTRLALDPRAALALSSGRDAAGAAVAPDAVARFSLVERTETAGVRMFPAVHPVPQGVWWDAQHRRVRYQRADDGAVQVNILGGRAVTVQAWGGSTPPSAGVTPGTGTPVAPTPTTP